MAKIYYVGDWAVLTGPVFAETPFYPSPKGLDIFNYGKWLKEALESTGKHEVESVERRLAAGEYHPAEAKRDLAERLVTLYHSSAHASEARAHFDRVFREKDRPEVIPEVEIPPDVVQNGVVWLPKLLTALQLAASNGEARRLVEQGGVRLDDTVLRDAAAELPESDLHGAVLQVGKRKFVHIV